jgi:hypothetical protein
LPHQLPLAGFGLGARQRRRGNAAVGERYGEFVVGLPLTREGVPPQPGRNEDRAGAQKDRDRE